MSRFEERRASRHSWPLRRHASSAHKEGSRPRDCARASGEVVDVKPGNAMKLQNIPLGTMVHNVELKPGKGAQIARSAGSSCRLAGRLDNYVQLKMPSGELRKISSDCIATIGIVSNTDHINKKLGIHINVWVVD